MAQVKHAAFGGWGNCVHIVHGELKLIVTADVGPRIISFSVGPGPNLFKVFDDELGVTAGDKYMLFGGHRLWHAPEHPVRSYCPDFSAVQTSWAAPVLQLVPPVEASTGIQKCIELHFDQAGSVRVRHTLINHSLWSVELAPWGATLFRPGSRAILPQEEYGPHPEHLDPARTITLWHYTRMNDPRVRWGERFIELREDANVNQQIKFGLANKQGWAACWSSGYLFIKTFAYDEAAHYADMGCNFETFTTPGFLELESLGPLESLNPGDSLYHDEIWHAWPCPELPENELELQESISQYVDRLTFPQR